MNVLAEILPPPPVPAPRIADIKQAVAREFEVSVIALEGPHRHRSIARPRQVAMWLARKLTFHSTPTIGKYLGGRDHSTVVVGAQRIDLLLRTDGELWDHVSAVLASLKRSDVA